jgi:hypothetical protein
MASNTDENENHWPGYVDALTTMTMVLTFVMMVLGIAIFTLSQNVSRGFLDAIAKAVNVSTNPDETSQEEMARQVIARIEAITAEQQARGPAPTDVTRPAASGQSPTPGETIASLSEPATEQRLAALRLDAGEQALRVVFKPRATTLDDDARNLLAQRLKSLPQLAASGMVEIRAGIDPANAAVSDAKRVAFYRAMRARLEVMQAGVPATRIHVIVDPQTPGDDVLVSFKP